MTLAALTLITEGQTKPRMAHSLAELLQRELGPSCSVISIDKYFKFDDSYKIELEIRLKETSAEAVGWAGIQISDKIASPWLVYFDSTEQSMELIFNKSEHTRFENMAYKAIEWGHWQIIST